MMALTNQIFADRALETTSKVFKLIHVLDHKHNARIQQHSVPHLAKQAVPAKLKQQQHKGQQGKVPEANKFCIAQNAREKQ